MITPVAKIKLYI